MWHRRQLRSPEYHDEPEHHDLTNGRAWTIQTSSPSRTHSTSSGWPWVKTGDSVQVTGRYYYDSAQRQGIDWTHHGSSRKWPFPGSVTVNGTVYQ